MNPQGFRWVFLPTRLAIYSRDGWRCLACGASIRWRKGRGRWTDNRPEAASLDHVVPRSAGGGNEPRNLITLCVGCNSSRCDAPVIEWRPDLADAIAIAVSSPIDRALGRALAFELDPAFARREERRIARRVRREVRR